MQEEKNFLQFKIGTAGFVFNIRVRFAETKKLCEKFIVPDDTPHDFEVTITEKVLGDIIEEAERECERSGLPVVTGAAQRIYYEFLALHKLISDWMPARGSVMFHCSSVMVDDEAYLFTAPSGTGKSTHASLWKKLLGERMTYINDDKPFIKKVFKANVSASLKAETQDDNFDLYACGSPWCGKHLRGENISAKIKAIGIIVRDEKNFVKKVEPMDAFITLYKQTYLPREDELQMTATVDMMKTLAERVPMYEIHCNMDIEAAEVAYAGLSKDT